MQFETLDEANLHLISSLNGLNRQQVYRRTKESIQLLEDERPYLLPLPVLKFSNYELRKSSINRYGLVQFQNNFYSVPETYSSKSILLKIYADRIEMLENDEIIATHIRLSGIEQYSLQLFHYLKVLKKKPGSYGIPGYFDLKIRFCRIFLINITQINQKIFFRSWICSKNSHLKKSVMQYRSVRSVSYLQLLIC